MDSEDSIRALVRKLGTISPEGAWNSTAGLLGSAHPEFVIAEMERQLAGPDIAVTGHYTSVLARLIVDGKHEPLSAFPQGDVVREKAWRERAEALAKERVQVEEALYQKAAESITAKQGAARGETVMALLGRTGNSRVEIPDAEIAAAFSEIPMQRQESVLSMYGDRIRVPAMVGPLKKLAGQPGDPNQPMWRDGVLRTLYETDAAEGRRAILDEIRHPHVDNGMVPMRAQTLGLLPEKTLAQLDDLLAARLEHPDGRTTDLDAQPLGRYATEAVLARVKVAYEERASDWDCAAEDGWLTYFLRTEPDYGVLEMSKRAGFCLTKSLRL